MARLLSLSRLLSFLIPSLCSLHQIFEIPDKPQVSELPETPHKLAVASRTTTSRSFRVLRSNLFSVHIQFS